MSVHVHLSGITAARMILAVALLLVTLLVALVSVPGLLLWPLYPGKVVQLLGTFNTWTQSILDPTALGEHTYGAEVYQPSQGGDRDTDPQTVA